MLDRQRHLKQRQDQSDAWEPSRPMSGKTSWTPQCGPRAITASSRTPRDATAFVTSEVPGRVRCRPIACREHRNLVDNHRRHRLHKRGRWYGRREARRFGPGASVLAFPSRHAKRQSLAHRFLPEWRRRRQTQPAAQALVLEWRWPIPVFRDAVLTQCGRWKKLPEHHGGLPDLVLPDTTGERARHTGFTPSTQRGLPQRQRRAPQTGRSAATSAGQSRFVHVAGGQTGRLIPTTNYGHRCDSPRSSLTRSTHRCGLRLNQPR